MMLSTRHFCPLCKYTGSKALNEMRASSGFLKKDTPADATMRLVKLLNGHVHGKCVMLMQQQQQTPDVIECTLPTGSFATFPDILQEVLRPMGVVMTEVFGNLGEIYEKRVILSTLPFPMTAPCLLGIRVFELRPQGTIIIVAPHSHKSFITTNLKTGFSSVFDFQLVSQSKDRLYLRGVQHSSNLDHHLRRMQLRQFSVAFGVCHGDLWEPCDIHAVCQASDGNLRLAHG